MIVFAIFGDISLTCKHACLPADTAYPAVWRCLTTPFEAIVIPPPPRPCRPCPPPPAPRTSFESHFMVTNAMRATGA